MNADIELAMTDAVRLLKANGAHHTASRLELALDVLCKTSPNAPGVADRCKTCGENDKLRLLLALSYAGPRLYSDDGELTDPQSGIDFRCEPVDEIERKMRANAERSMAASETASHQRNSGQGNFWQDDARLMPGILEIYDELDAANPDWFDARIQLEARKVWHLRNGSQTPGAQK